MRKDGFGQYAENVCHVRSHSVNDTCDTSCRRIWSTIIKNATIKVSTIASSNLPRPTPIQVKAMCDGVNAWGACSATTIVMQPDLRPL
jgi:hypothetical protein